MSLGELNTELVAAARSVRRPPRRPSYCPWASDAAILGVTVSNGCYSPNPVVAAFRRELPVGDMGARDESVDLSAEATRWFKRS